MSKQQQNKPRPGGSLVMVEGMSPVRSPTPEMGHHAALDLRRDTAKPSSPAC